MLSDRFNDNVKNDIMKPFSDIVLVVTLLSGVEKRVPWATVQVFRSVAPLHLLFVFAPAGNY